MNIPLLSNLNPKVRNLIFPLLSIEKSIQYLKNHFVFKENDKITGIFLVKDGEFI